MYAAVVEGPGKLRVRDVAIPKPGPFEALCKLQYGATCTGTDSHIIEGNFPFLSPYPTVLGHESAGEVVELGTGVANYRVGDLVTRVGMPADAHEGISITWGGFAEYGIAVDHWAMRAAGFPSSDWQSRRVNQIVPANVDPRDAPMFTTWRETLSYLKRMNLPRGFRILIIGSGGNALSYATHARILGAGNIAMVGSNSRREVAHRAGVSVYCDYRSESIVEELGDSGAETFDCILDAVGKSGAIDRVLPLLRPNGIVAVYGIDDYGELSVNVAGSGSSFTVWNGGYDEAETHGDVCEFYLAGELQTALWYDPNRTYTLPKIADAFAALERRESVKALIDLRGDR